MSFQDLPEPENDEHEHEYVERCTQTIKTKNPDMDEAKAIALCTTYYRNRANNLDGVTLKVIGTAKEREDGFLDLNGELHGIDEYTRKIAYDVAKKVVDKELTELSKAPEAFERIQKLETKIADLSNKLANLGELSQVKELLEQGTRSRMPITKLAHAIPEDHNPEYGIKPKLEILEPKKHGQQGLVSVPHPVEPKKETRIGNGKHLKDFVK